MLIIDAHQHFWNYQPDTHAWIDDSMKRLRYHFLPADLEPVLIGNNVQGCIAVQASQTEAETDFLLQLAAEHSFIKAVVGWVDLRADQIQSRLDHYSQFHLVKGFRHILQAESPAFMLNAKFTRGIRALKNNFVYEILVFPEHLPAVLQLVKQFPEQRFIIDHLAKPTIRSGITKDWEKGMRAIAEYDHVYVKLSGMVTEADHQHWRQDDFKSYLDVMTNSFGVNRMIFGSDWPVCLLAATYQQVLEIMQNHFRSFSQLEQEKIFGLNAIEFYQLK